MARARTSLHHDGLSKLATSRWSAQRKLHAFPPGVGRLPLGSSWPLCSLTRKVKPAGASAAAPAHLGTAQWMLPDTVPRESFGSGNTNLCRSTRQGWARLVRDPDSAARLVLCRERDRNGGRCWVPKSVG